MDEMRWRHRTDVTLETCSLRGGLRGERGRGVQRTRDGGRDKIEKGRGKAVGRGWIGCGRGKWSRGGEDRAGRGR